MFWDKTFRFSLLTFICLQAVLYLFIFFFHSAISFNTDNYLNASQHYLKDARVDSKAFSFLRSLGVWDAQWYLRIADAGYPSKEMYTRHQESTFMGDLSYAFFPLYPLLIAMINIVFHNIELSAFLFSNLFLLINFFSLYYVITKFFSKEIALKTIFLFFLFPFSIFYRSYFTESLFLFLLIWFLYYLIKQRWFFATLFAALIFITRPNGLFLSVLFGSMLYKGVMKGTLSPVKGTIYFFISFIPFLFWCYFNYLLTGSLFTWYSVQSMWFSSPSILATVGINFQHIFGFFSFPFHSTHDSQLDILMFISILYLLFTSKKFFKQYPQLWWMSFIIAIFPLLVKDFMSYSRYESVSFPLFLFLASKVTGWKFYMLCAFFLFLLLFTGVYFVSWEWVG